MRRISLLLELIEFKCHSPSLKVSTGRGPCGRLWVMRLGLGDGTFAPAVRNARRTL